MRTVKAKSGSLGTTLLKAIGAAGVLIAVLAAPNAIQLFKPFLSPADWNRLADKKRRRMNEELRRLTQRRLVSLTVRHGKEYLEITDHGRKILREFEFESIALPKTKPWDKKWRMVLFDIPERKRRARKAFQAKLNHMGFYPLQRSVFVYPHPCEDEIDFLAGFLELQPFVIYCEPASLGNHEAKARMHFRLL